MHVLKCKTLSRWEMFGNRTWSNIAWLPNLLMLNWMILSMWLSVCFLKCLIPFSATSSMFDHRYNILQILSNMVQSDKTWSNKVSKQENVRSPNNVESCLIAKHFRSSQGLRTMPTKHKGSCARLGLCAKSRSLQGLLESAKKNGVAPHFLRLFCRIRNGSLVSKREFTHLVGRWVGGSILGS